MTKVINESFPNDAVSVEDDDDCEVLEVHESSNSNSKFLNKVDGRYCCVKNCNSNPNDTQFFGFPYKKLDQRIQWNKALQGLSSYNDVICSKHFLSGKPSNKPSEIDYIPSVFSEIKAKRRRLESSQQPDSNVEDSVDEVVPLDSSNPSSPDTRSEVRQNKKSRDKKDFRFIAMSSDTHCMMICGVSLSVFRRVCQLIVMSFSNSLSKSDQVMIFFMKLRFNNPFSFIGSLFGIDEDTALDVFVAVTQSFYSMVKDYIQWVPSKEPSLSIFPAGSATKFPPAKAVFQVIEVSMESDEFFERKSYIPIMKYLIATTPTGTLLFVSKPYGCQFRDTHLVEDSGIMKFIAKGDIVICGIGFDELEIPIFMKQAKLKRMIEYDKTLQKCIWDMAWNLRQFDVLKRLDNLLFPHVEMLIVCVAVISNFIVEANKLNKYSVGLT